MGGTEGIKGNKPIKGAVEAVTGKEVKTQGLKDVLDTKGVFDVAKENGVPTGGVKDVVEHATGRDLSVNKGAVEVVTGKELPKMGLVHVIDKYGKGVYQTVRGWFQK